MANRLTLQIISADDGLNETKSCTFNEQGGSIGRSLTNTWVLPDEKKYLSGQHALISYNDGCYILTDTSTNGVFINNSEYSLGRGNTIILQDADAIQMGIYQIKVLLSAALDQQKPVQSDFLPDNDFFKEPKIDKPIVSASEKIPVMQDDDFFKNNDPESSFFKNDMTFNDEIFKSTDSVNPLSSNQSGSFKQKDPFDDDFFKEDKFTEPVVQKEKMPISDHEDALIQNDLPKNDVHVASNPFNTQFFEATQGQHQKIKDLDDTFVGGSDELLPLTKEKEQYAETVLSLEEEQVEKRVERQAEVSEEKPKIERPRPGTPVARTGQLVAEKQPSNLTTNSEQQQPLEQKTTANANANTSSSDVLMQFLVGVGIKDPSIQRKIADNMDIEDVGRLFRIAIQGTVDLLRSRTDTKKEMRISDATMIGSLDNNPLKFSITLEDTLIKLLLSQEKAYMTPERALVEAYNDMRLHQVAVLAGTEATFNSILERFRPDVLTKRFEQESPIAANIPLHRQAKLWRRFELLYEMIQEEAEEDFNRLLGKSFGTAYEKQVKGSKDGQ